MASRAPRRRLAPAAALLADLADADPGKRLKASLALCRTQPTDHDAVPALAAALADPSPTVRFWAATALLCIGAGAAAAVPALSELTGDLDVGIRRLAVEAIAAIGAPAAGEALPILIELLNADPDPSMRADVALALGRLADSYPEVVVPLREALGDPSPRVRHHCAVALSNLKRFPPDEAVSNQI